jgi:uncharacterized protein YjbI with pentapeptide repeats
MNSSVVGYDVARNVRDEERSVGRKKQVRKAEPPSKRGIRWPRWTGFRGMSLRSWLELLVVPLALVVIGLVFTMLQDARQQEIENQRAELEQKIEDQRAEAERELAEQRAQDEALQAYLDQMSQLMLDRKLLEAEQGTPLYTVAQARTSTLILRLDAQHNESVTRFLINSGLVESSEASAGLLRKIPLSHATLSDAHLPNADLFKADLLKADLSNALLGDASLSDAYLLGANLSDADLSGADLRGADLSVADLRGADLERANLSNADLSFSNLRYTLLFGANLSEADLTNVSGVTSEELNLMASSLQGATMPNGQKYEDWLKYREKRQQDEFQRQIEAPAG